MSSSLYMFLVMLFSNVGKGLNSRSQMFFKTGILKTGILFRSIHRKTDDNALYYTLDAQIWAGFSHLKRHRYMLSSL